MRFRVLGPLEFWDGSRWKGLSAPKWRALLGTLLVNANQVVSTEQLIEELWPGAAPNGAINQVHGIVARLRRTLGDSGKQLLITRAPGYRLAVTSRDVDTGWFESLVERSRREMLDGHAETAAGGLRQALDLWRGPALVDVPATTFVEGEIARLDELRHVALETRIEADLARGEHASLIGELRAMVEANPLRERAWAQLMTAQYRSGRQTDALRTYDRLCHVLDEELGSNPSAEVRKLRHAMLRADDELVVAPLPNSVDESGAAAAAVPEASSAPAQLPANLAMFTGREKELALLTDMLRADQQVRPAAAVVAVISGMAGVGKTALAVRWAHLVCSRYPDGQLFLDLHGFTGGSCPVGPDEALHRLLRALHVPDEDIPDAVDDRAALFRSRLVNRRMLILLDNAACPSQIHPLIPASSGCLVLVTSRRALSGIDNVTSLLLDVMPVPEAVQLFADAIGHHTPAGRSVSLAEDIVDLCGQLPLAVRIAATRLTIRPKWSLSYLAERLRDQRRCLAELRAGDETLTASFEVSYQELGIHQRRMFRTLGLHPGRDVERYAAAALAGTTVEHADRLLEDLLDAHLVQQHAPGRYSLHTLLRAYAVSLAVEKDAESNRRDAVTRLLEHYLRTAMVATGRVQHECAVLFGVPETAAPVYPLASQDTARTWLRTERTNLLATAAYAVQHGWPCRIDQLTTTLFASGTPDGPAPVIRRLPPRSTSPADAAEFGTLNRASTEE